MKASHPRPDDRAVACIVTFEPDDESMGKLAQLPFSSMLVVDNSVTAAAMEKVRSICSERGATLIQNGKNLGQAEALNQGCRWAMDHGYSLVLLLDQDTYVLPGFLEQALECRAGLPGDPESTILGCSYVKAPPRGAAPSPAVRRKRTVITSGSLVPLSLWARIGGFLSEYFIDMVDDEFCLRARRAGGTVWRIEEPRIAHAVGKSTVSRWARNHSAFRWYHMVRNHLWTIRRHAFFDPVWCLHTALLNVRFACATLWFEEGRRGKAEAMLRGARDGLSRLPPRRLARDSQD